MPPVSIPTFIAPGSRTGPTLDGGVPGSLVGDPSSIAPGDLVPRDRPRRQALTEFLSVEALSGIVLLAATIVALVWANVDAGSYSRFWATELSIGSLTESLGQWINDGLMAVFFFVVGLEIKRELVVGELRDRRTAALPAIAAVGGMVVPAAALPRVQRRRPTDADGWGVAIATDIAFAVAVLAVLGPRVPPGCASSC